MFMTGKYAFLSNYYNCSVPYNGITYLNAEAAFQAQKETNPVKKLSYADVPPNIGKRMGRKASLRKDWENVKDNIMYEVVKSKFVHNPDLIKKLLNVKEPIIEDNTWNDTYWGVCNGKGENKLGQILTRLQNEFRKNQLI